MTDKKNISIKEINVEQKAEEQSKVSQIAAAYSEEERQTTQRIGERIGRRQITNMIAKLLTVSELVDLQNIKESKQYKGFKVEIENGKLLTISSWDEYCQFVEGRSRQAIDLDLQNFQQLGEELFDAMRQVGIGPGKMRSLRKLPEDDKESLIEAAKSGDKDNFLELAEEIISRKEREKIIRDEKEAQLTLELDEAKADYEAQGELLSKKSAELDNTRLELEKARKRIQTLPPAEAHKELRQEVSVAAYEAEVAVMGNLREGFQLLADAATETGEDPRPFMTAQLKQIELQIIALREKFNLTDDVGDNEFAWMDESAAAEVAESIEKMTHQGESIDESDSN